MAKTGKPKDQPAAAGQGRATPSDPTGRPGWLVRVALSLAIAWHLFGVFISPLAVQPASIVVTDIATSPLLRWYTDSLYLNQGYHFFGPDPPLNQIARYQVTDAAGAVVAEGSFPDKIAQRPRLFYHRHMMLADQAGNGPPEIPPQEWLRFSARAYARQLLRRHAGDRATLEFVVHNRLSPSQSKNGVDPNAPETFASILQVEESAATLAEPLPIPPAPREPQSEFESESVGAEPLPPGSDP